MIKGFFKKFVVPFTLVNLLNLHFVSDQERFSKEEYLFMKYQAKKDAIVLLKDGTVFFGKAGGAIGTATGEICYNTGMTGYQEVFTDPSYFGQMMVLTNAHIGNYGVKSDETESSSVKISGFICRDLNDHHSRPLADGSLQQYFEKENIVAVTNVDTRALVSHVRDNGAMNAIISTETTDIEVLRAKLDEVPSMEGLELSSHVSTKEAYYVGDTASEIKVAVLDLGVKNNILNCLVERGCYLKVFPHNTKMEEMEAWNPTGYFLSNGPGDPGVMTNVITEVENILNLDKPVFGICLGHQMMALASGLKTYKMHNGHRGINHGVINLDSNRAEVTSQNHGFAVSMEGLENSNNLILTHKNLNDDTVEGFRIKDKDCFSVQFHPESSPGPLDSRYLFDQFLTLLQNK